MRISVAMASFNGEKFIRAQLESLLAQTVLPDELVITDDGSTDQTVAIAEAFQAVAPFRVIIVRNKENLGPAHNFASAMSRSTGDVVFLCDQDDVWDNEKIERMACELSASPEVLCLLCNARFADADLNTSGLTKLDAIRAAKLSDGVFVQGCCAAIRKELLELALPMPQEELAHDNWVVGLSDALGSTRRMNEALQYYRIHGNNSSDFFVNRTERESTFRRLLRRSSDILRKLYGRGGMEAEYSRLSRIYNRILARSNQLNALLGFQRANAVQSTLKFRLRVLDARLQVRSVPRYKRPIIIKNSIHKKVYPNKLDVLIKDMIVSCNSTEPKS